MTGTEYWIEESLEHDKKDKMNSSTTQSKIVSGGYESDSTMPTRQFSPQNLPGMSSGIDNRQTVLPHKILIPLRQQKGQCRGLKDEQEVRLLRYFIDNLSSWVMAPLMQPARYSNCFAND
jgi:hypothetical protein